MRGHFFKPGQVFKPGHRDNPLGCRESRETGTSGHLTKKNNNNNNNVFPLILKNIFLLLSYYYLFYVYSSI